MGNSYGAQDYMFVLGADDTAADTGCVLVDLSDSTNFPHSDTNAIHLLSLDLHAEKASDGVFEIHVGVITEVDDENGSAEWVHTFHLEANGNATDSTDRFVDGLDFTLNGACPDGLNLAIVSGATPYVINYGRTQAGSTNWQTDVGLLSPAGAAAGATGKPGAGDLVMLIDETSDAGTISWTVTGRYFTT